jgi:agmatinase
MPRINEERLARYRKLGQRPATDLENQALSKFLQRAEAEGCAIFEYPFDMGGKDWGFFRAPRRREALEAIDIACVGIPLDSSVPNFAGTRHGPEAVRRWSRLQGPMHHVTKFIPFEACSIADYGDVRFSGIDHSTRIEDIFRTYEQLHAAGVFPLSVGGEHTITYPILKAIAREEPLAIVHIDAHGDTTGFLCEEDDESHDGNFLSRAVIDGLVDPEKVIQIGIRGPSTWAWEFSHDTGMRVVQAEELQERGTKEIIAELREIVGTAPCYLTIDVDAIDPAFMPGTGVAEPFGLTPVEVRDIVRGVRGLRLIGADIAEICPARDPQEISANLGAALLFEMLCVLCEARVAHTARQRRTHWLTER